MLQGLQVPREMLDLLVMEGPMDPLDHLDHLVVKDLLEAEELMYVQIGQLFLYYLCSYRFHYPIAMHLPVQESVTSLVSQTWPFTHIGKPWTSGSSWFHWPTW